MPKLEPKIIQRELEQDQLWPVYWLFGQERMKSRELLKRIRKSVLGDTDAFGFAEESLDAGEVSAEQVLEAAQSLSLGFGGDSVRFVVVRDAHLLKNPEILGPLLQPRAKRAELSSVVVFLSKDLDGRKKFSKLLLEKAAVVPCEEVQESEREAWIQYLAKRKNLTLSGPACAQLILLDPWNLDIIDQELEKLSLIQDSGMGAGGAAQEVLLVGTAFLGGVSEQFLQAFFSRDRKEGLRVSEAFAEHPDESLPLLGLLNWNVRQLTLILADRQAGRQSTQKLNPYSAEKFARWISHWQLSELLELQEELARLDFSFKQTPLSSLGLWTELVLRFAKTPS